MHQTHAKKTENVLTIHVDPTRVARGHRAHRSGSGRHQDRRTARNRTRSQQNRNAIREG